MYDRFLSLRLGATLREADRAPLAPPRTGEVDAGERVLARVPGELRRDALVVARLADHYEVRRVGRVTDDQVELLPVDDPAPAAPAAQAAQAAHAERVPLADARVVGTVLLRWSEL